MINITIPVYNEEQILSKSIRTLSDYCLKEFSNNYIITIGDNASTDNTLSIAQQLQKDLPNIVVEHLDMKGRGRMLKYVWGRSNADILCYMDVDLSTGLEALKPLVSVLESGHSQIAIGTRLSHNSRVIRLNKREFISRSYNTLLRSSLRSKFSDAQCGFKGITKEAFTMLSHDVNDPNWFFDTELLYVAQKRGLRIFEIPVDWVDDPDTRVNIRETITQDLRGIYHLRINSKKYNQKIGSQLLPPMPAPERINIINDINKKTKKNNNPQKRNNNI